MRAAVVFDRNYRTFTSGSASNFPLPMKTLLLFLAASAIACAADEVVLQFPQLDLLDGRKLKNVAVKSYDAKSGDVLVLADGKALVIPIAQVPAPFADRVKNN